MRVLPADWTLPVTRREFFVAAGAAGLAACGKPGSPTAPTTNPSSGIRVPTGGNGRLTARPQASRTTLSGGQALGLGVGRDGMLFAPPGVDPEQPLPLAVFFHGGGGSSVDREWPFTLAAHNRIALLVPDSRSLTWDAVTGPFGVDVAFVDRALARAFSLIAVDATRVSIMGVSDGGTYSLSLGLVNGDLFNKAVAFSPGFVRDDPHEGKPRVYISHGTSDTVLPIHMASHVIVPKLRAQGYDITFREFDGGHTVPDDIAIEAFAWVS